MIAHTAAVATPHSQAAIAARDIILAGGNAFDAAVAAMLVNGVVQSHQVGIGGYGGNLVAYLARENKVVAIDFDSRAPFAFRPELYTNPNDRLTGFKAISVPAALAGFDLILRTYGTRSWADVTRHAIKLADEGYPLDATTHQYLQTWEKKTDPDSRAAWFPSGRIPNVGEPWVQKDLAQLMRHVAADGIAPFYTGDIARQIIHHIQSHGGIVSERDFAEYKPSLVSPVNISYRNYEVYTPPPPAGGITTLQILKTLENFDIPHLEPWGADYFHLFAEATQLCWLDRTRALGDPDVIEIPIDELLSAQAARAKAQQIKRATPQQSAAPQRDPRSHTANVTAVDRQGNVVSVTATQGFIFGSQVVIPGLGLIMGHGISRFDFDDPHHPNYPAPGKRMHHNMAPTIVLAPSSAQDSALRTQHSMLPRYAFGLPGGTKIITVTAQLAINFIDFHTSASECVLAPRMHIETGDPLGVSSRVPDSTIEKLKSLGHNVVRGQVVGGPPKEIGGNANALAIDPATAKPSVASQASHDSALVIPI